MYGDNTDYSSGFRSNGDLHAEIRALQDRINKEEARVAELGEQKRKLKWRLAYQAMHHVRLHNRWACGELEAPEEESIVNPFMYAETEVWWAIGDEADGFAKELEAEEIEKAGGES